MTEHLFGETDDPAGQETLEIFAETDHFNRWMFENLSPYCKDNILETGSGIGNISALLLEQFNEVSLSDLRNTYCKLLNGRFSGNDHLKNVYVLDLGEQQIEKNYPSLMNKFDTVLSSNVVEHVEDEQMAFQNCRKLLKAGGQLVILVPAYNWLYNSFDKELGHYRRYTKARLKKLFVQHGFEVVHAQYFNAVGILGWWFSGSVMRKKMLPKNQLTLYNKLIPFIRLMDKLLLHQAGLSVIVAGEKK
jgi:2-polyprenyl-3-methyl-5-hydroxy-6-metoxy-1,4-benzoquinol methylase